MTIMHHRLGDATITDVDLSVKSHARCASGETAETDDARRTSECQLEWSWDTEPNGDSVNFTFTDEDGGMLFASVENLPLETEQEFRRFVKDLEQACLGKHPLELDLEFYSYVGGAQVGYDVEQVVSGSAKALFTPTGVTFTVPLDEIAFGNSVACESGHLVDLRVLRMLSRISPHTFSEFSDRIGVLCQDPSESPRPRRRSTLVPTYRATSLTDEQVVEVLRSGGVFYFRQLTGVIGMKAEHLKPYFEQAGILRPNESVRDFLVTAEELLTKLIPYLDSTKSSYKLTDFVHFARSAVGLPAYDKPSRSGRSLD